MLTSGPVRAGLWFGTFGRKGACPPDETARDLQVPRMCLGSAGVIRWVRGAWRNTG